MNEFYCWQCHEFRWIKDFAFSFDVDGEAHGVCGWCAGCYNE
jgi:hypothetical protein